MCVCVFITVETNIYKSHVFGLENEELMWDAKF